VLWSHFLVSSALPGAIASVTNSTATRAPHTHDSSSSCRPDSSSPDRDWDITLNGSCDSVLIQVIVRGALQAGCDVFEALGFGFSSVFSLEPFNAAAIDSCNRATHSRDIACSLYVGDVFADIVFIAEGVRFPAHKVHALPLAVANASAV
jgi:hypothetical protein